MLHMSTSLMQKMSISISKIFFIFNLEDQWGWNKLLGSKGYSWLHKPKNILLSLNYKNEWWSCSKNVQFQEFGYLSNAAWNLNQFKYVSILPYMRHTEHDIYINGTTSVSKIINLHNSGVIRVLQTFGLIYSTKRVI